MDPACIGHDRQRAGRIVPLYKAVRRGAGRRRLELDESLTAISCPSTSLCVAVDDAGYVFASIDPTGGASGWTRRLVDNTATGGIYAPNGISCPSVSLCVAITYYQGAVLTSRNPTGGASAWKSTQLDDSFAGAPTDISCASASQCVIVDDGGNATVSTNPTGGSAAWHETKIDGTDQLHAVSCPSVFLCVAVDNVGNVVVGTSPATPAEIRTKLLAELTPAGIQATIPALLRNDGYSFTANTLRAGKLLVSWQERPQPRGRGSSGGSRSVLIATGRARLANSGIGKIMIKLTRSGKRILKGSKHLKLTAQGVFTTTSAPRVSALKTITIYG